MQQAVAFAKSFAFNAERLLCSGILGEWIENNKSLS